MEGPILHIQPHGVAILSHILDILGPGEGGGGV
jgi:hypothetical protein